jgi:uncharacterized protein YcfL
MLKQILTINLLALAVTVFAIGGCTQPPYDSKTNMAAAAGDSKIMFIDKDLRRTLTAKETFVAQGLVGTPRHIQVALRNITNDETVSIQVQTIFFDANGQALYTDVGSEAAWQNFTLTPGQTVYYKQNSLNGEAASYRVSVRYMNRKDAGN